MREAGGWDGQPDDDADPDSPHNADLNGNGHNLRSHAANFQRPELQEAFQPGSTSIGKPSDAN